MAVRGWLTSWAIWVAISPTLASRAACASSSIRSRSRRSASFTRVTSLTTTNRPATSPPGPRSGT